MLNKLSQKDIDFINSNKAFKKRPPTPQKKKNLAPLPHESGGEPNLKNARSYAATVPGAVSGQRGHDRTFSIACILVHNFHLSREDAYQELAIWNGKCDPPWQEKELWHKVDQAIAKGCPCSGFGTKRKSDFTKAETEWIEDPATTFMTTHTLHQTVTLVPTLLITALAGDIATNFGKMPYDNKTPEEWAKEVNAAHEELHKDTPKCTCWKNKSCINRGKSLLKHMKICCWYKDCPYGRHCWLHDQRGRIFLHLNEFRRKYPGRTLYEIRLTLEMRNLFKKWASKRKASYFSMDDLKVGSISGVDFYILSTHKPAWGDWKEITPEEACKKLIEKHENLPMNLKGGVMTSSRNWATPKEEKRNDGWTWLPDRVTGSFIKRNEITEQWGCQEVRVKGEDGPKVLRQMTWAYPPSKLAGILSDLEDGQYSGVMPDDFEAAFLKSCPPVSAGPFDGGKT